MQMKRWIQIIAIAAAVLVCVSLPFSGNRAEAASKAQVTSLNNQLDQLDAEKKQLEKELNSAKSQKNSAMAEKKTLDGQVQNLYSQIEVTNSLIAELAAQAEEKQQQADELQAQMDEKLVLFKQRMRASYEEGSISLLEVLFSAKDFSSMLSQMDIIESILDSDKKLIESLARDKAAAEEMRAEILDNKSQQEAAKASLVQKKSELDAKLKESDALLATINSNMSDYEAELKEIAAEEEKIEKELKKVLAALSASTYVGGEFIWPLPSAYQTITSRYGMRYHPTLHVNKLHTGTDIGAPNGTSIYAANSGTVITSTYNVAYGNYVVLDHGGGKATLYAHMSQRLVAKGDKVTQGQVIGKVGSTGYSTGNHLHFEIRINGSTVNPMNYFTKK